MVMAVSHFRYYLPFTVRTDHAAPQWLMSFRELEGQALWLEELQPYIFTVVHRARTRHAKPHQWRCTVPTPLCSRWVLMLREERELCEEVEICPMHEGSGPVCRRCR